MNFGQWLYLKCLYNHRKMLGGIIYLCCWHNMSILWSVIMKWIKLMNLKYFHLNWEKHSKENHFYSSSDSDSEDDEPRRFHVEIKPVQPPNSSQYTVPSLDELKVSIGNITLSPAISVSCFVPGIFNVQKSGKESVV